MERATTTIAGRTVEPRAPTLCASDTERQFLRKPDDLLVTVNGDGDFGAA